MKQTVVLVITLLFLTGLKVSGQVPADKFSVLAFGDLYYYAQSDSAFSSLGNTVTSGLTCKLHQNFIISPNIVFESYEPTSTEFEYQSSVTPRITFYYKF